MKMANPDQMKRIDQLAISKYKIPGVILMETAAQRVAEKARKCLVKAFLIKDGDNRRKRKQWRRRFCGSTPFASVGLPGYYGFVGAF